MPARAEAATRLQRLRPMPLNAPALAAWGLPLVLVLYLGLKGGGYDGIVRGEIGIAVCWILLLGALVGVLPARRLSLSAWLGLGMLALFAGWTLVGISWSESAERSVAEAGRVGAYLAVFALALAAQRPGRGRQMVAGVACGVAAISALAVLSRLHPAWFPSNQTARFLPGTADRLSYPVNYWNGLAALVVMGVGPVLGLVSSGRRLVTQALAAAALPIMALALYFTASRGGAIALGVALAAFLVLAPDRLPKLASLLVAGAGSAILIAAVDQRPALLDGLASPLAHRQGDEVLAMAVVVCAGVALLQIAIGLAVRHARHPGWLTVSPRRSAVVAIAAAAIAVGSAVAVGVPGRLSDDWRTFKQASVSNHEVLNGGLLSRLHTSYGNGRYQYWDSTRAESRVEPVTGTGPGTFEYWWARNGSIPSFVRNAHSLYFETWGELGIVGLLLIGALFVFVLAMGAIRALRAPPGARLWLAAATSACAAFAASATFDWVWQIAVLPVVFFVLAAVILGFGADRPESEPARSRRWPLRVALVAIAASALVMIAIPLAGTASIRKSQSEFRQGRLAAAIEDARRAEAIQPYAATPKLQLALLHERNGDLGVAAAKALAAARAEATNWRTWLVLARIEAERGHAASAVAAYARARSLNSRSALFANARS